MYKCQNCGKPATYFIKTNINGNIHNVALCAECAAKSEISSHGTGFDELSSFFNPFFFGSAAAVPEIKRCPVCGTSFRNICDTSKYGCAECYNTFKSESETSLRRLHGDLLHKGKTPRNAPKSNVNELEELRSRLMAAVEAEDYEKAAELRDRIKLINSEKEGE
ncbi:MAG: UvrB/UvrC motif-containing protein [Clostridia bacterium]|nr:UvrB/UvrC motif-containing protein [Clostridia bacterium]